MPALGGHHTADAKRRISETQSARLKAAREFGKPPRSKPCSACGKVKRVPQDFYMKTRKLVGGGSSIYPSSECKMCNIERMARWRQGKSKDELKKYWNRAEANRKAGRDERRSQSPTRLEPTPFYEWCERFEPELSDDEQHALRRIKSGEQKTIDLEFVDRIMTASGMHDQVSVLYPILED